MSECHNDCAVCMCFWGKFQGRSREILQHLDQQDSSKLQMHLTFCSQNLLMRCHKTKNNSLDSKKLHSFYCFLFNCKCVCVCVFINTTERSLSKALLFGSSVIHSLFVPIQTLGFITTIHYIQSLSFLFQVKVLFKEFSQSLSMDSLGFGC